MPFQHHLHDLLLITSAIMKLHCVNVGTLSCWEQRTEVGSLNLWFFYFQLNFDNAPGYKNVISLIVLAYKIKVPEFCGWGYWFTSCQLKWRPYSWKLSHGLDHDKRWQKISPKSCLTDVLWSISCYRNATVVGYTMN